MLYDARGNRYLVTRPEEAGAPDDPAAAVATRARWAGAAIARLCPGHVSDGMLVGPFGTPAAGTALFELLICNTDGSLAERSGNGLTIFATVLAEAGLVADAPFTLRVHHAGGSLETRLTPTVRAGVSGFWVEMGQPLFGPDAAGLHEMRAAGRGWHLPPLAAIDGAWGLSVPLRIGNPHVVTLVGDEAALPDPATAASAQLRELAFAAATGGSGALAAEGVNLQWMAVSPAGDLAARVFERGEGWTASSGTSATAVAAAAFRLGLVEAGEVSVRMPGGTAPVQLRAASGTLSAARLFGTARRVHAAR